MSKRSSNSNRNSLKEQKTQSGSKRGTGSNRSKRGTGSNRSKQSLVAPTQQPSQKSSQNEGGGGRTPQKPIAPPSEGKFDKLKADAIKARRSQMTQITEAKSMAKRETGYDKTQWELTKWADEAVKPTDIANPVAAGLLNKPLGLAPPAEVKATEVPGENRQEEGERGDYLLELPLVSLILNGIELLFTFLTFILSTVANGSNSMTIFGVYVTSLNCILCFIGAGFVTFWQWRHKDVAEEESKQGTKYYYVRGCSKKMYFHLHYWRMILYFLTFVILLYYANCGDRLTKYRFHGYCEEGSSEGLFFSSSFFSMFCIIPPIIHLVYIKKGIFAIVSFCRKN